MPARAVSHVAITLPYHGGIPIGDPHAAVFVNEGTKVQNARRVR